MYALYKVMGSQHHALIIVISEYDISTSVIKLPYSMKLSIH